MTTKFLFRKIALVVCDIDTDCISLVCEDYSRPLPLRYNQYSHVCMLCMYMYITNFRKLQCVCMYVQTGRINVLNILYTYIRVVSLVSFVCYVISTGDSLVCQAPHLTRWLLPLPHCLSIICILTLSTAQIIQQRSIETILLFGTQPYWQNCRFGGAFHRRVSKLYCTAPSDRSS